ncbi:PIN domain-containing protein [Thiothrix fructosivorans]|uniref:PIN domain-containing protein n=1 Tax=Thiothrix fructosivorans TaxID=111770 RepID=A0A8B0SED5_9GAMM|nr:PIN domain-containing protein [Thiothrix fructosivorans]MBO0614259.1 PIN domain-containing protein [Thiothrix fructosivorans]QTX09109.1 PIN domain-containing protein [Thiothrix fructosivorans]
MNARVFVDTNILVYSRDKSEEAKQAIALQWLAVLWQQRSGRISFQTLNEFYVTVTQRLKPGLSRSEAQADIRNLLLWNPIPVDSTVMENAWLIQEHHRFSWWDSLILSAAQIQDCTIVLSEDMQHEQQIGNMTIINPFLADIAMLGT